VRPGHVWSEPQIIRRYNLRMKLVIRSSSCRIAEGRKVDVLNFTLPGLEVNHAAIGIGGPSAISLAYRACVMSTRWVFLLGTRRIGGRRSANHSGSRTDLKKTLAVFDAIATQSCR